MGSGFLIEHQGAHHHVTSRGNERKAIFRGDHYGVSQVGLSQVPKHDDLLRSANLQAKIKIKFHSG